MRRIEVLDCPMDVATMEETVVEIGARIRQGQFTQHVVVNVAKLVNMRADAMLNESIRGCEIINIDGMGIVFGARFLGNVVPERVAGIDLFLELLKMSAANRYPVFLLGARESVLQNVCERVQSQYPGLRIVGSQHGYFWDNEEAVVERIRQSGARLLFVAISSPAKERFINRWKRELGVDFVMGVGGSFDVVAGKVKRAPGWMQQIGLEWLFRVGQEPGRMWRRYLVTNSKFLALLLRAKVGARFRKTGY